MRSKAKTPGKDKYAVERGEERKMTSSLQQLTTDLASGRVRVVDLTQTLSPEFPALQLPPQFGQVWAFKMEKISQYDEQGPGWYWNNFSCGEHTGTHFDAPVHWISGKDHAQNAVDTIDVKNFIAPAVVVDASAEVAANPDWLLTVGFLEAWEARHGRIPEGAWVLLRSDWSKRTDPAEFLNLREDGAHTPGPTQEVVEWLIHERKVHGFGVETINTDAGQAYAWPIPYPCHTLMHGSNRYGLQCLKNLDQLPPTGAVIVSAPLKIQAGSGSPLRVLALVQD
jgi:kynurenine formamidase